ncbi:MAG: sigma-70 family RNA polymerase sigma factor [Gemmatimonadales bacterium]
MLRIDVVGQAGDEITVRLEGRMVGPWVEELRRACEPCLGNGHALILDLSGVSFIDREGLVLCRTLLKDAQFTNCSPFVKELLMPDQEPSPAQSASSEAALIARLRARDPGALEILMERHASRVFRVAFGITRNEADAEEVVQDVFLSLFEKIGAFEERAALGTWLYRVTTNAALLRRRGKRLELEVSLEDQLPTFRDDGHRAGERSFLLADWSASAEDQLLSGELHAHVRRAIDLLPPHYRVVVLLRDIEELSNEETALILGEPVSSVKSRLHRARMALREQITRVMPRAPERLPC